MVYPRFDNAIAQGRVSLVELILAERELNDPDEVVRAISHRYYPRLLSSFEQTHGAITRRYGAVDPELSAVLTEGGTLDIQTVASVGFAWSSGEDIILDAEDLRDRIGRILSPREAYGYLEMIFNVITHVFGGIQGAVTRVETPGDAAPAPPGFDEEMARYSARLRGIEAKFLAAASRVALTRYFRGVMQGAIGLALAVAALGGASIAFDLSGIYVATLIAGGLGAIVSVMSRVARDQVTVDRR